MTKEFSITGYQENGSTQSIINLPCLMISSVTPDPDPDQTKDERE